LCTSDDRPAVFTREKVPYKIHGGEFQEEADIDGNESVDFSDVPLFIAIILGAAELVR